MTFHLYSSGNVIPWCWTASGGSEQYHIDLGRILAARGHRVISYTPLPDGVQASEHDGVLWRHCESADISQPGIWIVERDAKIGYLFAPERPHQVLMLAAHDLDYESFPETHWPDVFDAVLCESVIHAKYLGLQHGAKNLHVTGAGFCMDRIHQVSLSHRNYKRMFYASNPTRGLLPLLKIFHRAYEEDQELRLAIAYGWDYLEPALQRGELGQVRRLKETIMKMVDHPGVEWLGRLPSPFEVWREYAKSGMFVYPTIFNEIFCNAVGEAQCFGAIPIISPTFALAENTLHGVRIPGNPEDDRLVRARFVREVVAVANNPELQDKIRKPMMEDCRQRFDFRQTVSRIEDLANTLMESKTCAQSRELSSLDNQSAGVGL